MRLAAVVAVGILVASAPAALGQGGPLDFGLIVAQQSRPSFSIIGAGARAAGMGGAFTALADDASAASFNPAGLALLIKPEVSAVWAGRRLEREDVNVLGLDPVSPIRYEDTEGRFDTTDLSFASFTVPLEVWRRNLCIQLSYHRLIDFTQASDRRFLGVREAGGPVDVHQKIDQQGSISTFSLAGAYQLTPRVSFGTSMNRWRGQWDFSSFNEFWDFQTPAGARLRITQATNVEGWNWNFGILLRYPRVNLGFVYRTPFNVNLRYRASVASNFLPAGEPSGEMLPMRWPSSWTAGVALKPTDTWRITVDYSRYHWSKMEIRGVEIEDEDGRIRIGAVNFFDLTPTAETTTDDSGNWHFGSEVTVFAGRTPVQLRVGYFQDQQPQGLASLERGRLDEGFTTGAGVKLGSVAIDFAYQRLTSKRRMVQFMDPRIVVMEEPLAAQFALADQNSREHRVFLSVLYQFSREKMNRLLRYLFIGPVGS